MFQAEPALCDLLFPEQQVRAQFSHRVAAELAKGAVGFTAENVDCMTGASFAAGAEAIQRRGADHHRIGAESELSLIHI